ncbi:MAG: DUF21 domain-containing protein [Nitrospira sp.]|nr:DUF21 domain-containing protein [Nitrospira sp.]
MDILILLGLIGLSAVISTAEIGFFSVNETRLKALAQNGSKRAAKALQVTSDSNGYPHPFRVDWVICRYFHCRDRVFLGQRNPPQSPCTKWQ